MSEMINEELQGAVVDATPSMYGTPLGSLGSVSGLGSFGFHLEFSFLQFHFHCC